MENGGTILDKNSAIVDIIDLLARYNRKMYSYGKSYRRYGTEHQLRQEQIHLIDIIGRNANCNLRFLAEVTNLGVPTISLQIQRLKKLGLVQKMRSESSQRELEISLTEDGVRAFEYHKALDEQWFTDIASDLSQYSESQLETVHHFLYERVHDKRY